MLEPNDNPIAKNYQQALYEQGMPVIVFGADDHQSTYERLRDSGVDFRKQPTQTDWGYEAVFEDTCGNLVQIAQMA